MNVPRRLQDDFLQTPLGSWKKPSLNLGDVPNGNFTPPFLSAAFWKYVWFAWNSIRILNKRIKDIQSFHGSYIHTSMHAYIHTDRHTYIQTYLHTDIHTYIQTYLHTDIPTYLHTYVPTYIHSFVRSFIRSFVRSFVRSFIHSFIHS